MNKKILKIIERCASEMDEVSRFKALLTDDCLRFRESVSLETLASFQLTTIVQQINSVGRTAQILGIVADNIHRADSIHVRSDNFI